MGATHKASEQRALARLGSTQLCSPHTCTINGNAQSKQQFLGPVYMSVWNLIVKGQERGKKNPINILIEQGLEPLSCQMATGLVASSTR